MRFGLERMNRLLTALGEPQRAQPAIAVVGTNGKSSTTRFCAAILAGQGLRVGAYLSPHITGWSERILIDGEPLGAVGFADAIGRVKSAADSLDRGPDDRVTQFEALTAAAFVAFAEAGVDAAVVEAGLGGRFDATNVLPDAGVRIFTNVALEHTELLGDTVAQIAAEKLAISPDGFAGWVFGRLDPDAAAGVAAECARREMTGWRLDREVALLRTPAGVEVRCPGETYTDLRLGVGGSFQDENLAVAVAACRRFLGHPLGEDSLRASVAAVRIPGRLEVFAGAPTVVIDGAHNPAGIAALVAALAEAPQWGRPVAVMSLLADKDAEAMIAPLASVVAAVIATRSHHRRAVSPDSLVALAGRAGIPAEAVEDPRDALDVARRRAGEFGTVVVCGSLYLLADIRPLLVASVGGSTGR
jgi:dihydrofolate synthase / folylpolyglutamate synthase